MSPPAEASRKRRFVPSPGWGRCRFSNACVTEGTLRRREYLRHVSPMRREKPAPRQSPIPRNSVACVRTLRARLRTPPHHPCLWSPIALRKRDSDGKTPAQAQPRIPDRDAVHQASAAAVAMATATLLTDSRGLKGAWTRGEGVCLSGPVTLPLSLPPRHGPRPSPDDADSGCWHPDHRD
ncbi:hypothetical protein PAL_GLEAN10004932 [Pteropus alecto]|uniref:Uncharacterized protein n=1 Tax=Pteropus alecto TaxID=9402 RepID=L5KMT2_PTEAL|nr:hypothetical protein PAL_GLEAN10004932 [Pteropus alecto]